MTRKEKLVNYIHNNPKNKRGLIYLKDMRYLDLCEVVEFELKENIFDVLDSLNIKHNK